MKQQSKAGRPKYVYGRNVHQFASSWQEISSKTDQRPPVEPGFGWVVYVLDGDEHLFRIHLTPCSNSSKFFWVRLGGATEGTVDFLFPAPIGFESIDKLVTHWAADFDTVWTEGPLHTKVMPVDAVISTPFHRSTEEFIFIQKAPAADLFFLERRKGLHTLPKAQFAGVVCPMSALHHLEAFFGDPDVKFPKFGTALTPKVMARLYRVSASWSAEVLFKKKEGFFMAFMPHPDLVKVRPDAVSPLDV